MNNIDTRGLQHFIGKLKKFSDHPDLDWIVEKIAEIGVEEFSNAYNQNMAFGVLDIKSEITDSRNGKTVRILAIDDNQRTLIAFLEFGTGVYADGGYEGKLPNQPITFTTSDGVTHTTQGWEYYYNSEYKVNVGGVDGWFFGSALIGQAFSDGKQTLNTQNTFYRACEAIKERLGKELI